MDFLQIKIRSYDEKMDRFRVENLERRCEVGGPSDHVFLYTDTMGDPISRIRNSPLYNMLVAEVNNNDIVGIIQGSIKVVKLLHKPSSMDHLTKVGYILGLRVSPLHRRKGIGSMLVKQIEEWFITKEVEISYMATEKDNEPSVNLFVNKHGYLPFRSPTILAHPSWNNRSFRVPSNVVITKLDTETARVLYQEFMGSSCEFFPHDIDKILENKLSLGTWVAYYRNDGFGIDGKVPKSWAMVSVWNSGGVFKLRVGKAPFSCFLYAKSSRFMARVLPCINVPTLPNFFDPFGFYFMYGVYKHGLSSGKLVRALCEFVHNLAKESQDCKVVVTEIGDCDDDALKQDIPHWKCLSCCEDLWCIKALRNEVKKTVYELIESSRTTRRRRNLFVDPRDV